MSDIMPCMSFPSVLSAGEPRMTSSPPSLPHPAPALGSTPVLASLIGLLATPNLFASIFPTLGDYLDLEIQRILRGELWGLLWPAAVPSLGAFLLTLFLLMRARFLERLLGSARFALFLFIVYGLSTLSALAAQALGLSGPLKGPWALLGALLVIDLSLVPSLHRTTTTIASLRLPLTEKVVQLVPLVLVSVIGGASVLWQLAVGSFSALFARFVALSWEPSVKRRQPIVDSLPRSQSPQGPPHPQQLLVPNPAVPERNGPVRPLGVHQDPHVAQLVAMGFDVQDAVAALELTNMDLNQAAAILLEERRRQ